MQILLVEDERSIRITLRDDLVRAGHRVTALSDGRQALEALEERRFDCVITDIRLPGLGGMEILKAVKNIDPSTEVIMITGYGTIEQTVEAMKAGAYDYIQKPFPNEVVVERVARMDRYRGMEEELERLRSRLEGPDLSRRIVGRSRPMLAVLDQLATLAASEATVLLEGESGTGKEVVARAVHSLSPRAGGAFVAVSCAALPENLIEDELFGHEKGAFTDARKIRKGRFELADGGTLFLDDVDDLPLPIQVKLLRVLQEREFERIGGEETVSVDVRIIAATKMDLKEKVKEGQFREDLYYRLNVLPLRLPPLRERREDIPLLVRHFIRKYGGGRDYVVPAETLEAMERYAWPGNVRELENHVARAVAFAGEKGILERKHLLPPDASSLPELKGAEGEGEEPVLRPLSEVVKEAERAHIRRVLAHTGGHRTKTARILGISRKALWEKMKDMELD